MCGASNQGEPRFAFLFCLSPIAGCAAMFDFVARNKRLLQLVLAILVVPPFAFWGIDSYQRVTDTAGEVAVVDGNKISTQEFTDELRDQFDRMRALLGRNFDPEMFDRPELRSELLEGIISQRLVLSRIAKDRMVVTDDALREVIAGTPAFQENGKFSRTRYEEVLRAERTTPVAFETRLRRDLLTQQVASALAEGGLVSRAAAREWARLRGEKREISSAPVTAEAFLREITPSAEEVRKYYDENTAQFQVPEQARVEYVVLNTDAILAAEPVTAEEIKAAYESNRAQYEEKEQRQASHILFTLKQGATDAEKATLKARAEDLAAQARNSPAAFADLAKKHSEDPGSAAKGGDLGWFSRGMMVKAFEEAVFSGKPNDLLGPVESEFGFHVIRVTGIRPGKVKPLEAVRGDIERELRKQRAAKKFAESAEQFANTVYEQSDSLKPAADKFKLQVRDGGWISRTRAGVPELNNPKLLAAVFAEDAIKNRRNTEAVEVSQGTVVSARVVEHKPAATRPFEEVRAEVEQRVRTREGTARARKLGVESLAQLQKGEQANGLNFLPGKLIGRDEGQGLPPDVLEAAFRVPAARLPAYAGLDLPNGYVIVKVSRVVEAQIDEKAEKAAQAELAREIGVREFQAYLAALRASAKVQINKASLEKKAER